MGLLINIITFCSGLIALRMWYGYSHSFLRNFSEKLIPYERSIGLVLLVLGTYSFFNHLGLMFGSYRISPVYLVFDVVKVVLGFYQAFPVLMLLVSDVSQRNRMILIKNKFEKYYPFAGLLAVVLAITDFLNPLIL